MKWVRPAISIALLAILLMITDLGQVIAIMKRVDPMLFAVAIVLFALSILTATQKWHLCIPNISYGVLLRSYLSSLFFFLLPTGTLGAEASKLSLARTHHLRVSTIAGSIIVDKLTGLAALAAIGAIFGFTANHTLAIPAAIALLAGSLAIILVLLAMGEGQRLPRLLERASTAEGKAASLLKFALDLSPQPGLIWKSIAVGLVSQGLVVAIYACLASGLGVMYPLPEFLLCVVVANLAAVLPVSMGGIGVREIGLVALLGELGITAETATALALAVFSVFIIGALAGFVNQLIPPSTAVR